MRKSVLLLTVLCVLCLSGCGEPETARGFAMDTAVSVTVYDASLQTAEEALALCGTYEALFSRTVETSELSRLAAGEDFPLSDATWELLQRSLYWAQVTAGDFDPALGAVTELWDFTSGAGTVPPEEDIAAALSRSGWEKVTAEDGKVTLQPGTKLDLGGIAKGCIADRIGEKLRQDGVESALVNLGGDVLCIGEKPDGTGFQVGIQDPFGETGAPMAVLTVRDCAVVTSGVYNRCFEADGVLYHHILDPDTGYSARTDLVSVTVLTGSAADGDAVATACLVRGLEGAMELVNGLEEVWAVFVTEDGVLHTTEGLESRFPLRRL